VAGANYIGTADKLNSIKVKLPEQKFYTIVAVDKALWEEKGEQANYFSDLTYYSSTQPYSMAVRPSSTAFGGGKWIITNRTSYWVSFKKSDQSGEIYAVAPPNALRVVVPVELNVPFDYIPHFYKELKYNGKVIALVESDLMKGADTVSATDQSPTFNTEIGGNLQPPSAKVKPAIYVTNTCDKTVRVYQGQNNQLSNGIPGMDFALSSGSSVMFTGFDVDTNTNQINFGSIAWDNRVYVTQDTVMETDKVYKITISGQSSYTTTVTVVDGSEFYQ